MFAQYASIPKNRKDENGNDNDNVVLAFDLPYEDRSRRVPLWFKRSVSYDSFSTGDKESAYLQGEGYFENLGYSDLEEGENNNDYDTVYRNPQTEKDRRLAEQILDERLQHQQRKEEREREQGAEAVSFLQKSLQESSAEKKSRHTSKR